MSELFDFANMLSLEKAKLTSKSQLNFLGSKELTFIYTGVPDGCKEEAAEWLGTNRPTVTDPTFGHRTYEGTWYCVSIEYVDKNSSIAQRFKIDSALSDVVSEKLAGSETLRSYYYKIVNPDAYEIPASVSVGDVYTKNVQDNGDGTYDVTISKRTDVNQTSTSYSESFASSETTVVNTNSTALKFVSNGGTIDDPVAPQIKTIQNVPLENGLFRTTVTTINPTSQSSTSATQSDSYIEQIDIYTSSSELKFVSDGGSVPDRSIGNIKSIQNTPLDNGLFRSTVTTRTAVAQRIPPDYASTTADYPWLEYGSDYEQSAQSIISGTNKTWSAFIADRDRTRVPNPIYRINSISVRVNEYGLYDYTIISNLPG